MQVIVIDSCLACAEGLVSWVRTAGYSASLLQHNEETLFLITQISATEPIFVIGPTMPTHEMFALCHKLQVYDNNRTNAKSRLILISPDADDFTLQCDAAFVGAVACLPITINAETFLEAVTYVGKGCSLIPQDVMRQAFLPIGLTPAELDVLKIMAEGVTDAQIAYKLHKGHQTVRTQIKTIFEKLQVNTRTKAIYRARLRGLI